MVFRPLYAAHGQVLKKHYKPRPGAKELFEHFKTLNAPQLAVYSDYPFLRERLEALDMNIGPGVKLYGPESFGAQKPAVSHFSASPGISA